MQQRATFESIKTDDPSLFVVKVAGHLGTRQRSVVENLVQKCRDNGKSKVVFDLTELESMGGGVATVLGEFSAEMASQGHCPYFIGASSVVQSFMTARFLRIAPSFADDLDTARSALDGPVPEDRPMPQEDDTPRPRSEMDPEEVAQLEAQEEGSGSEGPGSGGVDIDRLLDGVVARRNHLTLADAHEALVEIGELRKAKEILEGVLHGHALAETCHLLCMEGDRLVAIGEGVDGEHIWLPAQGAVGELIRRRAAPVDLVDLGDVEVEPQEAEVLQRLTAQLGVPVFQEEQLEGIFFVRKTVAGDEYVASEELAIDLLARQIGQLLDQGRMRKRRGKTVEEKALRNQLRRQRTVLRLCRELHSMRDEDQLIGRLLISLIGEMNVASAIYYALRERTLAPEHVYGLEEETVHPLELDRSDALEEFDDAIRPEEAESEVWGDAPETFRKHGIDLLVPLRGKHELLGVLALAVRRSKDSGNFDADYLQALLHQAGVAAEHARTVTMLEAQMLRVAKTLIALIERRIGTGTTATTELVTYYTGKVAQKMDYDPEHLRDLLYGAVLRDVGMIEISDLVLRSPRSLSPEEWKLVQRHPISGVELLRSMDFSDVTCDVVLHHHERFNGEGYPHGLRGTAIPQGARIVSVVESYVAMTREVPYRPALSQEEAIAVLRENWEMRYDPEVVEAFVETVEVEPAPGDSLEVDQLLSG